MPHPQVQNQVNSSFQMKSNLILAMCFVYFVNFFVHSFNFQIFLAGLSVVIFLLSLQHSNSTPRIFSVLMFISGIIFYISKGVGLDGFVNGVTTNLPILILVMLVPLISIPLKIGGYFNTVRFYLEKMMASKKKLFGSISLIIFLLGPVLNLGSIRILHETIKNIKLSPVFLAKSYLVGFSTVILWSPYFASVALVLYYLKIPILDYLPLGLSMAIIQLIAGNLLFGLYLKNKHHSGDLLKKADTVETNNLEQQAKITQLLLIILLLMGSIFLLEFLTKWPMMFLVSLMSIMYPLLWSIVKHKWRDAEQLFVNYKQASLPRMNNEIVLFISAGFFGKALEGTIIASWIKQFLNMVASTSFLLFSLTVMGIIVILSFIGIHQIVVVTTLVTQIEPSFIGTRPEVIALLIMISWSMGAVLSPVNPLNLLVSNSLKRSGLLVGFKWNGVYLLMMFIIGTTFVYVIH
ncbi:hypothetical protein ACTWQL_04125 [Pseudalkalibacillus sp. R45]|uniref:hypothetical protein n=1 Tax=Pseudalkalibacillus sp. R45 TaxID=3457433 RepID=UPI003FCCB3DF